MNATLTIEQLLRAAQLLEQSNQTQLLNGLNDPHFYKLGQNYQENFLNTKMTAMTSNESNGLNSTGSSHRSSPSTMSAQSQSGSAPSSPAGNSGRSAHSTRQSRAAHNELEKNRRANLRNYLEQLKSVLPPDVESTRDTTLSLLTRARNFIRVMKERQTQLAESRESLLAENAALQERLNALNTDGITQVEQQVAPVVVEQVQPVQSIELPKPEPLMMAPNYLEFSPSAKPLISLEPLQAQLNVLHQISQLKQQLMQQQQQQQLLFKPTLRATPIDLINEGLLPQLPLLYPYTYMEPQV